MLRQVCRPSRLAASRHALLARLSHVRALSASSSSSGGPGIVWVDGVLTDSESPGAKVSVWDTTVQRGDGLFEVVRVLPSGGTVAMELHLDRLYWGSRTVELPLPDRDVVRGYIEEAAAVGGEGMVRLLCTRGGDECGLPFAPPKMVTLWQPLPAYGTECALHPIAAPWHPAGFGGWKTIKWLSYGPNMHMLRAAKAAGCDDALVRAPAPSLPSAATHRATLQLVCS